FRPRAQWSNHPKESALWLIVHVGDDMARKEQPRDAFCSFCRKHYRDVGPLVEGPGDVYICGECVELCQSIIAQEKRRRGLCKPWFRNIETPHLLKEKLDHYVSGQLHAKEVLATAVYHHSQRLSGGPPSLDDKSHILLIDPTRSSKIHLAWAVARLLEAP